MYQCLKRLNFNNITWHVKHALFLILVKLLPLSHSLHIQVENETRFRVVYVYSEIEVQPNEIDPKEWEQADPPT